MIWTRKSLFIGAHIWLVPDGAAITSPEAANVSQTGAIWPDADEPLWPNWKLGEVESYDIEPNYGGDEQVLSPPTAGVGIQVKDVISPYAAPVIKFVVQEVDVLAIQLALNTQKLHATAVEQFNPNVGGEPGQKGILKFQNYDHKGNLILNVQTWALVRLSSPFKGALKTASKPEYEAFILSGAGNTGTT